MMKKCNIRKKTLMLLIALVTIFNNINCVKAEGGKTISGGDFPVTGTCPPSGPGSLNCNASKGWTATCYKKSWEEENRNYIYRKIWDMNGNLITKDVDLESAFNQKGLSGVLAGTYIGLNLYEEKYTRLKITIGSTGIQEYHDCHYTMTYTTTVCGIDENTGKYKCTSQRKTKTKELKKQAGTASTACPADSGWSLSIGPAYYECVPTCSSALETCVRMNEPILPELNPSYKGVFQDSNDINAGKMDPLEPELIYDTGEQSSFGEWYWEKTRTKRFSFKLGASCINVKNGDIRYIGENGNCNPDNDEYEIKEEPEYWKYFIPLNSNSADDVSIILDPILESGIVNAGMCKSIMSNHPDAYMNLIIPANGSFSGNITNDKEKVSGGCYWGVNIKIPVIQRFYNEIVNNNTFERFKGFNFYYKPIDIDNPFPNGLNNTSIWYEWNGTNPNISQSYDKMIYYANTSGNEQEIRKYNDKNNDKYTPYASWDKLNKDGTSEFVRNSGIMDEGKVPLPDKNSFYNLGCGPKNTNVNNVFKQTECDG